MVTINLRDFYPWYEQDELVEVSVAVAEELLADKRYHKAHVRRVFRNKAQYSLDADDGIESRALSTVASPHEVMEYKHTFCRLCRALNSLPEAQGQRIEAHYILGMSKASIALAEDVTEKSVRQSIKRGLQNMRQYLKKYR